MTNTLSQTSIELKKQESLNAQSLRKTVSFRDINILDSNTIEYKSNQIKITKQAFKSLLSIIGMSQQFANKFEKLFTKEAKSQFINTMKNAMASNQGNLSNVTMVLNPLSKSVVLFQKEDRFQISNNQFINVAENMISDNSFNVTRWSTDPNTGIITIDTNNPKAEYSVNGLSNEVFTGGVTFRNSPLKGFEVIPSTNRMFCSNGLSTPMSQETYQLHSLDSKSMDSFFQNMKELRKQNFIPTGFADRVRSASNTPASIREMEYAHNLISKHAGERTEQWIPLAENMSAYNKAGFETLTSDQKQLAKTNQSLWSVTNALTHFSSHGQDLISTNMTDANAADIQIKAGSLFGKKRYDFENSMPNPFQMEALLQDGAMLN